MRKLRIRPQARVDMLEAWHYIARSSTESANHVLEEFEAQLRLIRKLPGVGHTRTDVKDERYRFWRAVNYLLVYRFDDNEVTVIRVLHGHRDIGGILGRA